MTNFITNSDRISEVCDTRMLYGKAAGFHLFLNERDSDVAIRVKWDGNTWHLPAHRLVLSSMSEVFRKMLDTDMVEKTRGRITITDYSPLTVKQFLRYLYMGLSDFNNWTETTDLLRMAHKYGVHALVILCESHLCTVVTFANVCTLYEMAQTYSLQNLEKYTSSLMLDAAYIVSATEGFLNLRPTSLEYFLKSKLLVMENECCVLSTLREWAVLQCSRNGRPLTRENVLSEMEPFMKCIRWSLIPEQLRTFVPFDMVENHMRGSNVLRKRFYVAASLLCHMNVLKFAVELGAFHERTILGTVEFSCLKFGVSNHVFIVGFKLIGMFRTDSTFPLGPSSLTLGRDNRTLTRFNLNSLPWTKGATVGEYIWQELTAYLPFPVRLDPFCNYVMALKYNSGLDSLKTRWPCTRLDSGAMVTSLGNINFNCCSECYGITQIFVLPAPPRRNVCNDFDSS